MPETISHHGPLHGVRVVDMAGGMGAYAGKLLADLGADVVIVEPSGGNEIRRVGPFFNGIPDIESGLLYAWMGTNKRSYLGDWSIPAERLEIEQLIARADVLLLSGNPSELIQSGLNPQVLCDRYPALVAAVISPFGMTGPYSEFVADDLVLLAMGGLLSLAGYHDAAPTAVHGFQSYIAGSLNAVVGTLVALEVAEQVGIGQVVDVAIQDCVASALETAAQAYDLNGRVRKRSANGEQDAGLGIFRCADGLISIVIGLSGGEGGDSWSILADWLAEDVEAVVFNDPRWRNGDYRSTAEAREIFARIFGRFCLNRNKAELYRDGQLRGLSVSPISTMADIAVDDQLLARGFFREVYNAVAGRRVLYPGPPYRFSRTPAGVRTAAPRLGEHTEAIRRDWLTLPLKALRPHTRLPSSLAERPLINLRIADFTWVGAGPFATKPLADFGGDVVKIESSRRPDLTRLSPPFAGEPGLDRSGYFANRNSSKRSINIDLKSEEGRDTVIKLIMQSDVVANNYRAGVMSRLGLSYEAVTAINPAIVYIDMPAFGNDGPARDYGGFGAAISAASGLYYLSGHPERLPVGTGTHYPDHVLNPLHATVAVLAALRHRRRTGEGQHIELSQFESSVNGVGYASLTFHGTGVVMERQGNRDGHHAPRVVVRCRGDDQWCAISVMTDAQWVALCRVMGRDDWLGSEKFIGVADRLNWQDEIEVGLEAWTIEQDPYVVMRRLQAVGVPCGVVQTADQVVSDPSLKLRHWWYLTHPTMGRTLYDGPCALLSRTPGKLHSPAPMLGQHTAEVLEQLAAMESNRLSEYSQ